MMSETRRRGTAALVIGGANGVGAASCEAIVGRGSAVAVADIDTSRGESLVAELRAAGAHAVFLEVDVLSDDSVRACVEAAETEFGYLDGLVNSAGRVVRAPQEDAFDRNVDMLMFGVWRGLVYGVPALQRNGGGAIVNVASIAGVTGSLGSPGYGPAKHAVVGMTRELALKHAAEDIRVNAVCPGYVETQMTAFLRPDKDQSRRFIEETLQVPMQRWGQPKEIGAVVAFLLSDQASYLTGQPIIVDGGILAR
jgi:meso-butanediol dehydrogenase / (S,S)-butanediol dehydrogenase / diacetyl reductase